MFGGGGGGGEGVGGLLAMVIFSGLCQALEEQCLVGGGTEVRQAAAG